MTLEEKEKYLLKASYNREDIRQLTGFANTMISNVMNFCREKFNGSVPYRSNVITARSFWLWNGTSIEEEYRLLGVAKGYVK